MGHTLEALEIVHIHKGDFIHLEPVDEAVLLVPGIEGSGSNSAAHRNAPVTEGDGQLEDFIGFVAVKTVMSIEILHLDIIRGDTCVQTAAHLRIHVLQNACAGNQRAEKEIP